MAYFDYSPPEIGSFSEALKPIGDALTEVMKRRQQREEHDKTLQFQREVEKRKFDHQVEYDNYLKGIEARKERMGELEFNQRQQERNAARMDRARHAANPQEAAAIAADTVTYDPHTTKEIGRGRLTAGPLADVGPAPVAQQAPELPPQIGAAIPDIAANIPGMPPEIAARLRSKRPEPEAGAMVGPIPSADEARHAEIQRIGAEPPTADVPDVEGRLRQVEAERADQEAKLKRFEAQSQAYSGTFDSANQAAQEFAPKAQAYEQDMESLPGRQAAHTADVRRAEATRPYTISLGPNDPGTTFDFETQRYGERKDIAERFLAGHEAIAMSDQDRNAARHVYAGIMSGTIDPTKADAAFQRERMGISAEGGKNARASAHDATTIKAAEIRANAPHMDWKELVGRGNLSLSAEREGNAEFQAYLRNVGYKADVATMKDLVDTNESLKVGNTALDVTAGAAFARKANGAGVLTDKDFDRFWGAIGDGEERTEDWFERAITGKMGEGKRRKVIAAVSHRVDAEEGRIRNMATQADKKFANEPWYPGTRRAYFDIVPNLPSMGGAAGPRIGTSGVPRKGAPPEVAAGRRAKVKAKGDAVEQALKALEGTQ